MLVCFLLIKQNTIDWVNYKPKKSVYLIDLENEKSKSMALTFGERLVVHHNTAEGQVSMQNTEKKSGRNNRFNQESTHNDNGINHEVKTLMT